MTTLSTPLGPPVIHSECRLNTQKAILFFDNGVVFLKEDRGPTTLANLTGLTTPQAASLPNPVRMSFSASPTALCHVCQYCGFFFGLCA